MAVGEILLKKDLNTVISGYATQLRLLNLKLVDIMAAVGTKTDADLLALGFTADEVAKIRKYYVSMDNMLLNTQGLGIIADDVTVDGNGIPIMKFAPMNEQFVRIGA